MPNYSKCSITGKSYSQNQIHTRLTNVYRDKHIGEYAICCGCGRKADDNSHTISQKRCKEIHKASLIFDLENLVDLCRQCHITFEVGGEEAKKLFCYEECMEYIRLHDLETYNKRMYLK